MNENVEIDVKKIFRVLLKRLWIIVLCAALVGGMMMVYTQKAVTPMYTAGVTMYVNNNGAGMGFYNPISSTNLAVALQLVNSYVIIIRSDTVLEKVIEELDVNMTPGQIRNMMTATSVDETEIFTVEITYSDPELAADIANTIAEVAPEKISSIIEGSSAKVIDYSKVPQRPSSPNVMSNTVLGVLAGALLAAMVIVIRALMDVRIKDESDLEAICNVPVLGRIPDISMVAKTADKKVKR